MSVSLENDYKFSKIDLIPSPKIVIRYNLSFNIFHTKLKLIKFTFKLK